MRTYVMVGERSSLNGGANSRRVKRGRRCVVGVILAGRGDGSHFGSYREGGIKQAGRTISRAMPCGAGLECRFR